jgi:hypothetical protein
MARGGASRRTYAQIFLDELTKLSEGKQQLVANSQLREVLDWDEERYDRVRGQLRDEGKVIVGRGRGGTVGIANAPGAKPPSVFISYSHVDEELKVALVKHLGPLRRSNLIDVWHDRKIKAGDQWGDAISGELQKAGIILLLVSIDFIDSKYCFDVELEQALELHAKGKARVVPVILRSCLWSNTPFAKLQAVPKDGKAVTSWQDRDEALVNVAEAIRLIAEDMQQS